MPVISAQRLRPAPHLIAPLAVAAVAVVCASSGIDHSIAAVFFDPVLGVFTARGWPEFETFGHRLAKSLVWLVWALLLATALGASRIDALVPHRRLLWTTTVAMALGPAVVTTLKLVTGPRCPWDLVAFGGQALEATSLFTGPADAGRCFPSGHSAGGFSLFAFYFAGVVAQDARLRRIGLWAALAGGTVFSLVRMAQGAHFLSHTLWAGITDWLSALVVFALADQRLPVAPASS